MLSPIPIDDKRRRHLHADDTLPPAIPHRVALHPAQLFIAHLVAQKGVSHVYTDNVIYLR